MKACLKCCEVKPLTEFNRNSRRPDGLDHRCKPCHREQSKQWQRGIGKDKHSEAVKRYLRRKPEVRQAADRRTREKHPTHWRARRAVSAALLKGALVRPDSCSVCGEQRAVQAHHHRGYDEPFWLDVQWLCTPCHTAEHRRAESEAS